jgi:glutathione peroxidase-family protein
MNTVGTRNGGGGAKLFTKADVNGPDQRPTYKFLKEEGIVNSVSWNFQGKFVVDKKGTGIEFFR